MAGTDFTINEIAEASIICLGSGCLCAVGRVAPQLLYNRKASDIIQVESQCQLG